MSQQNYITKAKQIEERVNNNQNDNVVYTSSYNYNNQANIPDHPHSLHEHYVSSKPLHGYTHESIAINRQAPHLVTQKYTQFQNPKRLVEYSTNQGGDCCCTCQCSNEPEQVQQVVQQQPVPIVLQSQQPVCQPVQQQQANVDLINLIEKYHEKEINSLKQTQIQQTPVKIVDNSNQINELTLLLQEQQKVNQKLQEKLDFKTSKYKEKIQILENTILELKEQLSKKPKEIIKTVEKKVEVPKEVIKEVPVEKIVTVEKPVMYTVDRFIETQVEKPVIHKEIQTIPIVQQQIQQVPVIQKEIQQVPIIQKEIQQIPVETVITPVVQQFTAPIVHQSTNPILTGSRIVTTTHQQPIAHQVTNPVLTNSRIVATTQQQPIQYTQSVSPIVTNVQPRHQQVLRQQSPVIQPIQQRIVGFSPANNILKNQVPFYQTISPGQNLIQTNLLGNTLTDRQGQYSSITKNSNQNKKDNEEFLERMTKELENIPCPK